MDAAVNDEPRWWRSIVMLGLLVGIAIRAWPWLREPLLYFEDGTVFFGPNYRELQWGSSLQPYAGYVPVGSNLAAMLLCRLPTDWIASAFVATAAAVQWLVGCTLLQPGWRALAPFSVRAMLAVGIVLLPIGSHIEFTTLAYMQWPMLCWLFLLLVAPSPRVGWRRWPDVVLVVLLTWSHPLAVVLAPLGLLRRFREQQPLRWLAFVGGVVGYWLVTWIVASAHGAPDNAMSLLRALQAVPAVLVRVCLESFVGIEGWRWLEGGGAALLFLVAAAVLGAAVWLVRCAWPRWNPSMRAFALACVWLALVPLAIGLFVRDVSWRDAWIVRYLWLGRVAFWMLVLAALTTLRSGAVAAAVLMLCMGLLSFSNARYHVHAGSTEELRAFLTRLQEVEQRDGHRRGIEDRLDRPKQPPIVIRAQ